MNYKGIILKIEYLISICLHLVLILFTPLLTTWLPSRKFIKMLHFFLGTGIMVITKPNQQNCTSSDFPVKQIVPLLESLKHIPHWSLKYF